jgi:microcystin-dependent protein
MNQQFDFSLSGGFPLSQDVLEFMQGGYSQSLGAMNNLIGHLTITAGTKNTEGWIYVVDQITGLGELLPFFAGAFSNPQFSIAESTEGLMFKDSRRKQVKITRYITRNLSNNNYNSNEVQDISYANNRGNIVDLWDKVNAMQQIIEPIGTIKIWASDVLPSDDWMPCDGGQILPSSTDANFNALYSVIGNRFGGTNNTAFNLPNLIGNAPVGGTGNSIGNFGGASSFQLDSNNLPTHTHQMIDSLTSFGPVMGGESLQSVGKATNNGVGVINTDNGHSRPTRTGSNNNYGASLIIPTVTPNQVFNFIIKVK